MTSCLSAADRPYLRKHIRKSKNDPFVEEIEMRHGPVPAWLFIVQVETQQEKVKTPETLHGVSQSGCIN